MTQHPPAVRFWAYQTACPSATYLADVLSNGRLDFRYCNRGDFEHYLRGEGERSGREFFMTLMHVPQKRLVRMGITAFAREECQRRYDELCDATGLRFDPLSLSEYHELAHQLEAENFQRFLKNPEQFMGLWERILLLRA